MQVGQEKEGQGHHQKMRLEGRIFVPIAHLLFVNQEDLVYDAYDSSLSMLAAFIHSAHAPCFTSSVDTYVVSFRQKLPELEGRVQVFLWCLLA